MAASSATALATTGLAATPVLLLGLGLVGALALMLLRLFQCLLELRNPGLQLFPRRQPTQITHSVVVLVVFQDVLSITQFLLKPLDSLGHLYQTQI